VLGVTVSALCHERGASGTTTRDYVENGMPELVADRWACAYGFPPPYIWPEMIDHALEDIGDVPDEDLDPLERKRKRDRNRKRNARLNKREERLQSTEEAA
jgi:hypothetical protein